MSTQQWDRDLVRRARDVAVRLAREAGTMQREHVGGEQVSNKGTVDLVTELDIASEKMITEGLNAEFPGFRLIGEEGSEGARENDYGWYIDPIDGTTNFSHRYPHWAVSIALDFGGEPIMGVVYDPNRDEMFTAIAGEGAFLNDKPIRVSQTDELIRAIIGTGFAYDIAERGAQYAFWQSLNDQILAARRTGAAALDMVWVACGRQDAFGERWVNSWDVGAGVVIVREAGGTVTALDGGPYVLANREVCASNGVLHERFVRLITEHGV